MLMCRQPPFMFSQVQMRAFNSAAVANPEPQMKSVDIETASSTDGNSSDGQDGGPRGRGQSVNIKTPPSQMNIPIKVRKGRQIDDQQLLFDRINAMKGKQKPVAHYPIADPKIKHFTLEEREEGIRYSSWKLNAVCNLIRGQNIIDAQVALNNSQKKGAVIVRKLL